MRLRALGHSPVLVEGDARDHRDPALGDLDGRLQRGTQLGGLAEGFDEQRVNPFLNQGLRLLEHGRPNLGQVLGAGLAGLAEKVPARADRSEHVRLPARDGARDAYARGVELADARLEAVLLQPQRVRAKRVRLDHLRSGAEIVVVHLGDELRPRDVQLFEASAIEDPPLVQLRTHRAVDDQDVRTDGVEDEPLGLG
jgi:hypothetical protein